MSETNTNRPQNAEAAPTSGALHDFILQEWRRSIPTAVTEAAKDIADQYSDAVDGVLYYGSCLRTGEIDEKVLDFYVVVENYSRAYKKRWLAVANKIIPPNVFYHEIVIDGTVIRSKYAVISRADLAHRVGPNCLNASIWARFCQPCMLLLARNDITKRMIALDISEAHKTMIGKTLPLVPVASGSRVTWIESFEQTYAAELRSERRGKGQELYLLDKQRYEDIYPLIIDALGLYVSHVPKKQPPTTPKVIAKTAWFFRRMNGKFVSFMRLLKATVTFDGGIDYIAWKIRRHSGVNIEVKDWMRKYPIIAGMSLFFSLRKKGAFK